MNDTELAALRERCMEAWPHYPPKIEREAILALLARLAAAEAVCKAFAVWEATPNPEHGSPKAYTDLICAAGVWQTLVGWSGRDTMALMHDSAVAGEVPSC